jgi:myo-inositol-1(or 4)-monophosphatase
MSIHDDLARIERAIEISRGIVAKYTSGAVKAMKKAGGDPVTEADLELDKVLKAELVKGDDGWLSEETVDDLVRLEKKRVWIVDPIDGTKEFVQGIDEWCVSIALAEDGVVIAAGIFNPARDETIIGSRETGVTLNGKAVRTTDKTELSGATALASRSEVSRGEWDKFMDGPMQVVPMGSVAYKLARVGAGLDDITFTLVSKNEWDYAAGAMLVEAAGGKTIGKEGQVLKFNNEKTLISGLIASTAGVFEELTALLEIK